MTFSYKYCGFIKQISRFFLFVIPIFFSLPSIGQSSVVTSGKDIENVNGSVSYTIGSVFYLGRGKLYPITEGIQQSYIINEIPNKSSLRISLFPNPAVDFVYFKVENLNYENLSFRLYDISGRLISKGVIINSKSSISIGGLPNSIYIIKIYRNQHEEQSFKIFKAN